MLVSAVGQDVCLGFANTLAWRGREAPAETLADFAALLAWAQASAALPAPAARELGGWAREHPSKAATEFAEAIALREAIYRISSALACGEPVRNQDFVALGRAVSEAPARRQLARSGDGCAWQIELGKIGRTGLPAATPAPVLWSAADLMVRRAPPRPMRQRCASVRRERTERRWWRHGLSCGNRAKRAGISEDR
jgi:predicted RNA-binding Zn ribbon-like protein